MADFERLIRDYYEFDHVELKSKRANWDFLTGKYWSGSVAASVLDIPTIVAADAPVDGDGAGWRRFYGS